MFRYTDEDFDLDEFKQECCNKLDGMDFLFISKQASKHFKKDNIYPDIELKCVLYDYKNPSLMFYIPKDINGKEYECPYMPLAYPIFDVNDIIGTHKIDYANRFMHYAIEEFFYKNPDSEEYFNGVVAKYVDICIKLKLEYIDKKYKLYKEKLK